MSEFNLMYMYHTFKCLRIFKFTCEALKYTTPSEINIDVYLILLYMNLCKYQ